MWRPAVSLTSALRTLDRWSVDEIIVLDISRQERIDDRFLRCLAETDIRTPLTVGGGIRTCDDIARLLQVGCDRFVIETELFSNVDSVKEMTNFVGQQALIGSIPITIRNEGLESSDFSVWSPRLELPRLGTPSDIASTWFDVGLVAEILVTAVEADGRPGNFPLTLPTQFIDFPEMSIIWAGGIDGDCAIKLLNLTQTAAISVGLILQHSETVAHSLRSEVRSALGSSHLRKTALS
jgi:cyclase